MGLISRVSSRTYRNSFSMSIENYNGGAVVAMTGGECFAIACDRRFGVNLATVGFDFEKVFQMGDKLFCGLGGFVTDIQTVHEKLLFRKNLYEQREGRKMTPKVFEAMVSICCTKIGLDHISLEVLLLGYIHPKTARPSRI